MNNDLDTIDAIFSASGTSVALNIDGANIDSSPVGATTPSTGAFTTLSATGTSTLTTVDINGGAIDGTTVGSSSASTGAFTTLSATGALTANSVTGTGGSGVAGIFSTSNSAVASFTRAGTSTFNMAIGDLGAGGSQLWFDAQTTDTGYAFRTKNSAGTTVDALFISPSGAVTFNEGSLDVDFRVESNGNANALFVDGGTDAVGIGIGVPLSDLHLHDEGGLAKMRFSGTASSADTFTIGQGTTGVANSGFSIYDVEATANRLVIDTSGNVSVGYDHSVAYPSDANFTVSNAATNGMEFSVEAISGENRLLNYNRTSSTYQKFTTVGSELKFAIGASEAFRIDTSGKFIVGDTSALNSGGALGSFVFSGGQGVFISTVSQATGEVMGFVHQKTSVVGTIAINSSSTTYNTSSDARLKNVLGDAKGLEIVNQLNPVNFEWKESKEVQDGLIAQEVEEIVPNAVSENSSGYYQMDYSKLVTPLIKAVQELSAEVEQLKQQAHEKCEN